MVKLTLLVFLLLCTLIVMSTRVNASSWDFIKDFFNMNNSGGSDEDFDDSDTNNDNDHDNNRLFKCPMEHWDLVGQGRTKSIYANHPRDCPCPEGMIKCRYGDFNICLLQIDPTTGNKRKCPKL